MHIAASNPMAINASDIDQELIDKEVNLIAEELKNHHIYITASINEPSGNHHIEAGQCGLPILYIGSMW